MWRCVSRSIKGTFEKTVFKCNSIPITKVTNDSKQFDCLLKLTPALVEHFNRYYGYYKSCYSRFSFKNRERKDNKAKNKPLEDLQHSCVGALSWCSILILGWYYLQPLACRRVFHFPNRTENGSTTSVSKYTTVEYKKIVNYFAGVILTKPITYVLPEVKAVKNNHSEAGPSTRFFSPDNERVKEGLQNLEKAHQKVTGAFSNWLGTECMQLGRYKEAVSHFKEAAELNNAAAVFNLGICHEMGYGTSQDFKKAAELYRRASDLGHATAMYNLGVFHVHGWGGLPADTNQARELFQAAAQLGQGDAKRALRMEKKRSNSGILDDFACINLSDIGSKKSSELKVNHLKSDKLEQKYLSEIEPKSNDSTDLLYKILNINMESIQSDIKTNSKGKKRFSSADSGVLDMSPDNELDVFV